MRAHRTNQRLLSPAPALTLALGIGLAVPIGLATSTEAASEPARAVLDRGDSRLTYTAAAGQVNQVTVTETSETGSLLYVIDDSVAIDIVGNCSYPDSADHTRISCSVVELDTPSPYDSLMMNLGDRDDKVDFSNTTGQIFYRNAIDLGPGNDALTPSGNIDGNTVWGKAGNDTITVRRYGSAHGGDGNDVFFTRGPWASAEGGKGNDVLHGSYSVQHLEGGDGNDTISGAGSGDFLYGGRGDDRLYGGKGNDTIYGNSGNDRLFGNDGNDFLSGGPGKDLIDGGPGNDTVR